jgi:uncharacterized protein YmfQ (DUF2313 family)
MFEIKEIVRTGKTILKRHSPVKEKVGEKGGQKSNNTGKQPGKDGIVTSNEVNF